MDAPVVRPRLAAPGLAAPGSVNLPDATETDAGVRMAALLGRATRLADLRAALDAVTLEEVADAARFSREGYARVLLARSEGAEILILGWLPGQRSLVHDHGVSHGFVKVLAGEGVDDSFALEGGRAVLVERTGFEAGALLEERPDQVHRVANAGSNVLITLHAYAPCLRGARTYDE